MPRRGDLAERIADAIIASHAETPAGKWLPTSRELAKTHDVSLGTVQAALAILSGRRLVEVVPGKGSRKLDPDRPRVVLRAENDQALEIEGERGFRRAVIEAGLEPWDETPGRQWVKADPEVSQRLGLPIGTEVYRRSREHGWKERDQRVHVMLSATWYIREIVEEIPVLTEEDTGPGGTTSRFEDAGYRVWWEVVTYARAADDAEAEWLGVAKGSALLDVWRRCFDQSGRILEVTQRVIDPAKHQITFVYGAGMPERVAD